MPSEAQLVKRFGVSRPTIARALRSLSGEGLIERRAGSGSFVKSGGTKAAARSNLLALLVPSLGNTEIFQLICGEITSLAREHEYGLVWGGSELPKLDPELSLRHSEELCQQFIEKRVDGVFFPLTNSSRAVPRRMAGWSNDCAMPAFRSCSLITTSRRFRNAASSIWSVWTTPAEDTC